VILVGLHPGPAVRRLEQETYKKNVPDCGA
jgi:hypothetical protein